MNKLKIVNLLLAVSVTLNIYLLIKVGGLEIGSPNFGLSKIGIVYQENCPDEVTKNRICSIEVLEKRSDFAMVRVHYHYVKGAEYSNKVVVKANKGSHDNTVGTRGGFDLIPGDNTIDIPFGMYRAGIYTEEEPYMSKYIMVKAQGITEDGKRYTSPHIFEVYAKYEQPWYMDGNSSSWQ